MMTVYNEFEKTAEKYPGNPFLHIPVQAAAAYSQEAIDYSYDEANERIMELRGAYQQAGYGPGFRVAVILDNRAEFFLHFLALNSLGVSTVPVNSGFLAKEMQYVIEHSDACLVLSLPEYLENAEQACADIKAQVPVLSTEKFELLPQAKAELRYQVTVEKTETAMLYTSGTTGEPKGCMLSNEYFISMGIWYRDVGGYCRLQPGKERMLTPLPLVHMNALCSMMAMIMSGGCIIQLDRFHASSWWQTVRESKATCLHYLGVIPAILLNQPETEGDDFSKQVKFGFGAGVDPKHLQRFEERFGFPLVEGWAMTETGTAVCITAHEEPRHIGTRCIGRAPDLLEYKFIDEQGEEVKAGEPGELLVKAKGDDPSYGFFSGYYKNPEETQKAWEDGYFHTGDVMRVDEQGFFYFVDRRKNIVRRSGENIAAVEVEGVVFQHDAVANCVVAPVPDEFRGEEVGVFIILNEGFSATKETAESIFAFCNEKLVYYKTPGYLFFVDSLPMTASQKIQRGEVKKLCKDLVEKESYIDLRELKRKRKS